HVYEHTHYLLTLPLSYYLSPLTPLASPSFPTRRSSDLKSFARSPIEPSSIPNAVHETTVTTTTSARAGTAARPGLKPSNSTVVSDRKSTRLNSSHVKISYAVFCLKKKKKKKKEKREMT